MSRRPDRRGIALLASLGLALVGLPLGCSNQYADVGAIDISASKAAAAKNGINKFENHAGRVAPGAAGAAKGKPGRPR